MVIITALVVLLRYGFNIGFIWMQESVRFMYAAVFLICAGYTLLEDKHVRVDVFYQKMSPQNKALVDIIGTILLLWLYFSWDMTRAFYPNSANALCQGAKISQSLVAIKYILPVEEKTPEGTVFVQRENKIISN